MSKALERPSEWHKENARREKQQLVDCYVVGYALPEDPQDEYNAYFPCTPQGHKEALSFIASHLPLCDKRPYKTKERKGALPW
jgi:hypothetical protein